MSRPTRRPTAGVRGLDDAPLDRDDYADALRRQADGPDQGDRVRLHHVDGRVMEGVLTFASSTDENDVQAALVLVTDDGAWHYDAVTAARTELVQRSDHPRLPLLTDGEAQAVAALLDELAAIYPGEDLGRYARDLAVRLYDRCGI